MIDTDFCWKEGSEVVGLAAVARGRVMIFGRGRCVGYRLPEPYLARSGRALPHVRMRSGDVVPISICGWMTPQTLEQVRREYEVVEIDLDLGRQRQVHRHAIN